MSKPSTKEMVDAYLKYGSYREAARQLGVSVQMLHKRIRTYETNNDLTIGKPNIPNYHAMSNYGIHKLVENNPIIKE